MSDMNEKTPHAYLANGVLHNNESTSFIHKRCLINQTGKLSIYLTEDELELTLLEEFEKYRKQNTISIVLVESSNIRKKH